MTGCITAWYGKCSASDCKVLQRVVCTPQYVTGARVPAIQDFYTRQCKMKALKMVEDSSHQSRSLFSLLPHRKRYLSAKSGTKSLLNSFYPKAIRLLKRLIEWLPGLSAFQPVHSTSINHPNYPSTLTRYRYSLYIATLLLFYCITFLFIHLLNFHTF